MASRRASSSAAPPSTHLPPSSTAAAEEDSPRAFTSSPPNTQSRPPSTIPLHLRGESFQGRVSRRGTANSPSPGSDANYPSWLPRRPAPPAPPSTFGSFDNGYHERGRGALANLFGWRSTPSHSRNPTSESGYVASSLQPHRASIDPAQPRGEGEVEVEETQGRKATPRSVRIISVPPEARSKETSDQTRRQSSGGWGNYSTGHVRAFSRGAGNPYASYMIPHSPLPTTSWPADPLPTRVAPRFKARTLNLGLLRSTSRFDRLRFHFSPFTYFAHIPVQLFFDFNAIFILTQITTYPTPLAPGVLAPTPSPTWSFALTAYVLCVATWLIGVVVLYEVIWSFWRRWRVKRPGMMGIFSSRVARNLAGMGNFERWCFLHFVRRGAWTDMNDITPGPEEHEHDRERQRERAPTPSVIVGEPTTVEEESMGGGTEGKKALRRERERLAAAAAARREEHADVEAQLDIEQASVMWYQRIWRLNYRQGFVEWAWDRSQNIPTVVLLLPRAGIALAVLLTYSTINPTTLAYLNSRLTFLGKAVLKGETSSNPVSRDSTFFSGTDGTLTTYAKTVLWANCGWTLWKILILLIAYVALWIASGQSCAGICGPRYRWEEEERIEWEDMTNVGLSEKYGHSRPHTRRRLSLSGDSTITGYEEHDAEGLTELLGWRWRENTRRRIREAYQFCLSSPPVGRKRGDVHMRELGGSAHRRSRGGTDDSRVAQVIKASSKAPERGRLSSALFVKPDEEQQETDPPIHNVPPPLFVPITHQPIRLASQHVTPITELAFPAFPPTAYATGRPTSSPSETAIPFPSPTPPSEDHIEGEEYLEGEEVVSGRETASMSSLGQPVNTRYPIGMGRPRGGRYSHSTGRTGTASDSQQEGNSKSTPSRSSRYSHQKSKSASSHHPSDPSSNQPVLAGPSNLPPPPSAFAKRRRRKETPSEEHLPFTASPQDLSSTAEALARQRPRATSSDPAPEPLYESDGDEEFVEGVEEEEEEEGEEGSGDEEEDSVGLLGSKSPSPRGSFAAIRQRASSISGSLHRSRTRSQGSQSQSNSNSSGNHRNRTRSLIQYPRGGSAGPSAIPSPSSSQSRSRRSSLPPVSERFSGSGQPRGLPGEQIFGQGIHGRYSDETQRDEVPEVPPLPRIRQLSGGRPEQIVPSGSRVRSQSGTSAVPSERTIQALSARNLDVRRNPGETSEADPSFTTAPATPD